MVRRIVSVALLLTLAQFSWQDSAFPVLSERYDIQAKADHPVGPREMLRLLQTLLEDRFKLVVRRETKEIQSYALVVDKGGPRLHLNAVPHASDDGPLNPYHARGGERSGGYLVFKDETMADFAFRLSTLVVLDGRVVVDKTGLDGHLRRSPRSPQRPGLIYTNPCPPRYSPLVLRYSPRCPSNSG